MLGWILFILLLIILLLPIKQISKRISQNLILILIILFSGLRYKVGMDYDSYLIMYEKIKNGETFSLGWTLVNKISILMDEKQLIFIISSILIYYIIIKEIYKNSTNWRLSVLCFIFLPYAFWHSLSIIRQYIAISLFMLSINFLLENKNKKCLFINLLAMTFHRSSVISILIIPFVKIKLNRKIMFFIMLVSPFMIKIANFIVQNITYLRRYNYYFKNISETTSSRPFIHLFIRLVILVLIIIFKDSLGYNEKIKNRVYINLYFIGSVIYLIFFYSEAIRRIGYSFMIFEIFLIPMIFQIEIKSGVKLGIISLKYLILPCYICYIFLAFYKEALINNNVKKEDSLNNHYYRIWFLEE